MMIATKAKDNTAAPCPKTRSHLPADLEGAGELLQLNVGDAGHLARLLNVGSVCADGQPHQVLAHVKLVRAPATCWLCRPEHPYTSPILVPIKTYPP